MSEGRERRKCHCCGISIEVKDRYIPGEYLRDGFVAPCNRCGNNIREDTVFPCAFCSHLRGYPNEQRHETRRRQPR